jgi:hypothetical protein
MILLSGKVGYRRHLGPAEGNLGRATFVFGPSNLIAHGAWFDDTSRLSGFSATPHAMRTSFGSVLRCFTGTAGRFGYGKAILKAILDA